MTAERMTAAHPSVERAVVERRTGFSVLLIDVGAFRHVFELDDTTVEVLRESLNEERDDRSVLGSCPHGIDLDRDFCPHGCRI